MRASRRGDAKRCASSRSNFALRRLRVPGSFVEPPAEALEQISQDSAEACRGIRARVGEEVVQMVRSTRGRKPDEQLRHAQLLQRTTARAACRCRFRRNASWHSCQSGKCRRRFCRRSADGLHGKHNRRTTAIGCSRSSRTCPSFTSRPATRRADDRRRSAGCDRPRHRTAPSLERSFNGARVDPSRLSPRRNGRNVDG